MPMFWASVTKREQWWDELKGKGSQEVLMKGKGKTTVKCMLKLSPSSEILK